MSRLGKSARLITTIYFLAISGISFFSLLKISFLDNDRIFSRDFNIFIVITLAFIYYLSFKSKNQSRDLGICLFFISINGISYTRIDNFYNIISLISLLSLVVSIGPFVYSINIKNQIKN